MGLSKNRTLIILISLILLAGCGREFSFQGNAFSKRKFRPGLYREKIALPLSRPDLSGSTAVSAFTEPVDSNKDSAKTAESRTKSTGQEDLPVMESKPAQLPGWAEKPLKKELKAKSDNLVARTLLRPAKSKHDRFYVAEDEPENNTRWLVLALVGLIMIAASVLAFAIGVQLLTVGTGGGALALWILALVLLAIPIGIGIKVAGKKGSEEPVLLIAQILGVVNIIVAAAALITMIFIGSIAWCVEYSL